MSLIPTDTFWRQRAEQLEAELESVHQQLRFLEQSQREKPTRTPKPTPDHISLRDWFAGQAMNVLLARIPLNDDDEPETVAARMAYALADAMLKERNKP